MSLYVPVSVGEALDKFSILSIKLTYIQDPERRVHIQKEYDALHGLVVSYKETNERLYELLKQCNERLWFLVDAARMQVNDPRIVYENDARFRIKRKLNHRTASVLQEQKNFHHAPLVVRIETPLTPELLFWIEELSIYCDGVHGYCESMDAPEGLSTTDPDIVFHPGRPDMEAPGLVVRGIEDIRGYLTTYRG